MMLVLLALWACSVPVDLPTEPAAPGAGPTGLATWYIEWLSAQPERGEVPRSAADYAALAKVVEAVDADVWALQEVDGKAAVAKVFPQDEWQIFVEARKDPQNVAVVVRRGLQAKRYPDVQAIAVGNRGLRYGVDVRIGEGEAQTRVLAVHLKSQCAWDPLDRGDACRTLGEQAAAVEAWADARAAEGVPFVVMGDFNRQFTSKDAFWNDLADGEPEALMTHSLGKAERCGDSRRRHPVDHIVLSEHVASRVRSGSWTQHDVEGSDHCPVSVKLAPCRGCR